MQIHLFISDSVPARHRLKAELKNILETNTVIHHQVTNAFDPNLIGLYNEPVASVIMLANHLELYRLAHNKFFWKCSKNILILPDEEPETLNISYLIRPVFISNMDDNFSKVVLILEHIKNRFELDIQNS